MLRKYWPPPTMFRFVWFPVRAGAFRRGRFIWLERAWHDPIAGIYQPMEMFTETESDRLEEARRQDVENFVERLQRHTMSELSLGVLDIRLSPEDYARAAMTPPSKFANISILSYIKNEIAPFGATLSITV